MKHSNLMIGVLSLVIGAYALIGFTERMRSTSQGWHSFQLKSIGRNRFLLRRLDQFGHEEVVELQEEWTDEKVVKPAEPDILAETGSGSGSGPIPVPDANTVARAYLGGSRRGNQRRTGEIRVGSPPSR